MLNFLNIFKNRQEKRILDPFVGNGTIALLALIENFQVYGSDVDSQKVIDTKTNLKWLFRELGYEEIPYLDENIKTIEVENLSNEFPESFFDGIVTEPDLGAFYTSEPYYTQVSNEIENKLQPLFTHLFREAYNVLKPKARICLVAPTISVVDDKKDVRLNIVNIANKFNFKMIPLISSERIVNKSNKRLQFRKDEIYSILDAKKNQIVKRKIYVFEKRVD
jgi:tRNA G10  N-methylase Trm11